jgi:hypothetical protein
LTRKVNLLRLWRGNIFYIGKEGGSKEPAKKRKENGKEEPPKKKQKTMDSFLKK